MAEKKQIPLRLSEKLYSEIAAWAEDDFRSVNSQIEYLEYGIKPREVTIIERFQMIEKHLEYLLKIKPEKVAILELRTHAAWYLKYVPHSNSLKQDLFQATTKEEVLKLLKEFKRENGYEND